MSQSEREEKKKNWTGLKEDFVCCLIGSAREGFSWKTVRDWLKSGGGQREFLEGRGEM